MRTQRIIITVDVKCKKEDAADFGMSLGEHIMETFNDDDSIVACYSRVEEKK